MRLPRRVPWSSISELDQVCSWIYANEDDLDAQNLALNRLAAWRASTSLPLALEATQNLLAIILQDKSNQGTTSSSLSLRLGYAAAVIRFVNGLVDPLQFGAYARAIASIAAQLGLPSWLVELRHAATHDDLPSLELLREAANESMRWLFSNYFIPMINPSVTPPSRSTLRPLAPLLEQYKTLLKITTRDASLKARHQPQVTVVVRDIERWIAEAQVAASGAVARFGWGVDVDQEDPDSKEKWALNRLCDALLEKGALVPLSGKKRIFPTDRFFPPGFSIALWEPLLRQLQNHHPLFPGVLINCLIARLTDPEPARVDPSSGDGESEPPAGVLFSVLPPPPEDLHDATYDACLARWAMWAVHTWDNAPERRSDMNLGRTAVAALVTAVGPETAMTLTPAANTAAGSLLRALTARDPNLDASISSLTSDLTALSPPSLPCIWKPDDIVLMDQRWNSMVVSAAQKADSGMSNTRDGNTLESDNWSEPEVTENPPAGWVRLTTESVWKACPIGMLASSLRT